MKARLVFLLLFFCIACQSGRIPCPDARGPRMKKTTISKRNREYSATLSASKETAETKSQTGYARDQEGRFVKNVTVEEWDCPKPGEKKYMPRSVKENIRKNMKRIKSDQKKHEADSLQAVN